MSLRSCPTCGTTAPPNQHTCKFCGASIGDDAPLARLEADVDADTSASATAEEPHPPADRATSTMGAGRIKEPPALVDTATRWMARRAVRFIIVSAILFSLLTVGYWALDKAGVGPEADGRDAVAGAGSWAEFADPDGRFVVDFPTEPTFFDTGPAEEGKVRLRGFEVAYPNAILAVYWADYGASFAAGSGANGLLYNSADRDTGDNELLRSVVTVVDSRAALQYVIDDKDAGLVHTRVAISTGQRIYYVWVAADTQRPAGFDRMVESFAFTDGTGDTGATRDG